MGFLTSSVLAVRIIIVNGVEGQGFFGVNEVIIKN